MTKAFELRAKRRTVEVLLVLGPTGLFIAEYVPLHRSVGNLAGIFVTPAVLAAAALFGARAGMIAGVASYPLNALLVTFLTGDDWWAWARSGGNIGCAAEVLVGWVVGRLHDTTVRRDEEIARRLAAETEQLTYQRQLHDLSQRLVTVQEDERRQTARELHDECGQILTALRISLEMTQREAPGDTVARLDGALAMIATLHERVRTLSLDLRPSILDDLGVLAALEWLCERTLEQTDVQVHLRHRVLAQRFARDLETGVYRIVQEALTNVVRHAGVREATVWVEAEPHQLRLQMNENGFHAALQRADETKADPTSRRASTQIRRTRRRAEVQVGIVRLRVQVAERANAQSRPELSRLSFPV